RATATPEGSVIGYFAIRDISRKSPGELEHRADDFAAGAFLARLLLGHHALRGRHDRDPESARDRRQLADALVDAAAGFAHPDKLLDDGTAVVVLEGHPDTRQVAIIDGLGVVGDVTLVLEDLENRQLAARRGHAHLALLGGEAVADTRQHIGDGV